MTRAFHSLILAAGKGTRMKSDLPKVVHRILGQPMVEYVIDAVETIGSQKTTIVVGYKSELVRQVLASRKVDFVEQNEQLGTGHAVQCYVKAASEAPPNLLVVCGDTPLISTETLEKMVELHFAEKPAITMMTLDMESPGNYGRIIRRGESIAAIREAKDCNPQELQVKEVNLAVYIFDGEFLQENIFELKDDNNQKEFYLTDLVEMAFDQNKKVISYKEKDESSTLGINSRYHLAQVSGILEKQIVRQHMENGVTIVDPAQTIIGPRVRIEPDTEIWPASTILGDTFIGRNSIIGPNTMIENSTINCGTQARLCVIKDASVSEKTIIEPFSSVCGEEAS